MDNVTLVPVPPASQKEMVERCLRSNSYLALSNISCDSLNGVVVLRGCLPTYYLKQVAQEVVFRLEGVDQMTAPPPSSLCSSTRICWCCWTTGCREWTGWNYTNASGRFGPTW